MKVFISWSGERSRGVAEALRGWIPGVLQSVKPYFTPDDIDKGARWGSEISKELEDCSFGIICVTAENIERPWIMFEAGALSKRLGQSLVCPLLFDVEPGDIAPPLQQFQATRFARDEMFKLMSSLNRALGDGALETQVIADAFELWWPKLDAKVKDALQKPAAVPQPRRDIHKTLDEILEMSRRTYVTVNRSGVGGASPAAIADLQSAYNELCAFVRTDDIDAIQLAEIVQRFQRPMGYFKGLGAVGAARRLGIVDSATAAVPPERDLAIARVAKAQLERERQETKNTDIEKPASDDPSL